MSSCKRSDNLWEFCCSLSATPFHLDISLTVSFDARFSFLRAAISLSLSLAWSSNCFLRRRSEEAASSSVDVTDDLSCPIFSFSSLTVLFCSFVSALRCWSCTSNWRRASPRLSSTILFEQMSPFCACKLLNAAACFSFSYFFFNASMRPSTPSVAVVAISSADSFSACSILMRLLYSSS